MVAEPTPRGFAGGAIAESLSPVRSGAKFDVKAHFLGEVIRRAPAANEQREPSKELADHAVSNTRAIAPATR